MKKAISLLLSLAMLLGVGSMLSVSAADAGIKVGFGRFDFTPDMPVNMTGIDARDSEGTLTPEDRLYISVVAMSDADNNIALICTVDMLKAYIADEVRQYVSTATGVPVEKILFSATHTHSAPDADDPAIKDVFLGGFATAAKEAIADLSPVTVKYGTVDIPYLNHVRHYWRQTGIINGNNFTVDGAGKCLGSVVPVDDELQILRFVREGKKDVLMLNWQVHATNASCTTVYGRDHKQYLSADFIGYARNYIEAQDTDALVAYYSGASGNVAPQQLYATLRDFDLVPEDVTLYGKRLGEYIMPALQNLKTISVTGSIKSIEMDHKSIDVAKTAVTSAKLGAISVGKTLVFASHPYEMFNEHGVFVKENSPFDVTFVLTNSNGDRKYVPTMYAFAYTEIIPHNLKAYEVSSSQFTKGAGEDFAQSMVNMLNVLYK